MQINRKFKYFSVTVLLLFLVCVAFPKTVSAANGMCGSATNGDYSSAPPTGDLCYSGTPTSVSHNTSIKTWNWDCQGTNGGSTMLGCQANDIGNSGGTGGSTGGTGGSTGGTGGSTGGTGGSTGGTGGSTGGTGGSTGGTGGSTATSATTFTCADCDSLVCCGNPSQAACTFQDLFCLVKKVINFILFTIIPPLAVVWFAYAGFLMLTAAGDPGKTKQARDMILYVVIGILIAYAAWLLVYWFIGFIGGTSQAEWLRQFFE